MKLKLITAVGACAFTAFFSVAAFANTSEAGKPLELVCDMGSYEKVLKLRGSAGSYDYEPFSGYKGTCTESWLEDQISLSCREWDAKWKYPNGGFLWDWTVSRYSLGVRLRFIGMAEVESAKDYGADTYDESQGQCSLETKKL